MITFDPAVWADTYSHILIVVLIELVVWVFGCTVGVVKEEIEAGKDPGR